MMIERKFRDILWGEAIKTANYPDARAPTCADSGRTKIVRKDARWIAPPALWLPRIRCNSKYLTWLHTKSTLEVNLS
jgi:hypothetical protein